MSEFTGPVSTCTHISSTTSAIGVVCTRPVADPDPPDSWLPWCGTHKWHAYVRRIQEAVGEMSQTNNATGFIRHEVQHRYMSCLLQYMQCVHQKSSSTPCTTSAHSLKKRHSQMLDFYLGVFCVQINGNRSCTMKGCIRAHRCLHKQGQRFCKLTNQSWYCQAHTESFESVVKSLQHRLGVEPGL